MSSKNVKTLRALKTRLKKTLPQKISEVIASYEEFCSQPVPEDAKGFASHHNACKSAVVHAETLLKLARWTVDEENVSPETGLNLERLLAEAGEEEARLDEEE